MQPNRPTAVLIAALFVLSALATSCAADDGQPDRDGSAATATRRPTRIVSLSPTATEMLFAIGAGDQVVAVDDQSNYPPDAPKTDLSGNEPNVEAIAAFEPDLVVVASDGGELVDALEAVDLDVHEAPAAKSIDDTYAQIEDLGDRTGHRRQADELVTSMKRRVDAVVARVPTSAKNATYYHELDPTYFTATSKTFIGNVYSLLGLENIADDADIDQSGYPQLSAEKILTADPDLIFLADTKCCAQTPDTVRARDGWAQLRAVRTGSVVALDDDIASRWGPRVVDFLDLVADRVVEADRAA